MDPAAHRILHRFLEGYERPTNMVPVWNKDQERVVYVLPKTLQDEGSKYEKVPDKWLDSEGKPAPLHHPGQPHLPRKPKKPHKPMVPRQPPPAPVHPPIPTPRPLPPKEPKPVKRVKPPKVPVPSRPHDHKKVRRFLQSDVAPETVVQKFLASIRKHGV